MLPRGHHRYTFIFSLSCCDLLLIPIVSVQWLRVRRPDWCLSLNENYRIVHQADESGEKTETVETDFNFDPSQARELDTDDQIKTKARTSRQDLGKVS